jgi:hypothetical protein
MFPVILSGQITLEHNYGQQMNYVSVASGEFYYVTVGNNTITLWDSQHQRNRDINIHLPYGYYLTSNSAIIFSRTLFDNDDSDIEVALQVYDSISSYKVIIFEENGNKLHTFDNTMYIFPISTSAGWKLLRYEFGPTYEQQEVWSVPGNYHLSIESDD